MSAKKIFTIINPISGTSKKINLHEKIMKILSDDEVTVDIAYTEYPGHATLLAKEAADKGYNIVLAVGGDGTCNEIAKALVYSRTALAIIPTGSGNGLARHLGIPMGVTAALKALKDNGVMYVSFKYGDFEGIIDDRYFTYLNEQTFANIINQTNFKMIL